MSKGYIAFDNDNQLPSLTTPHGSCYISTPAATTITVAGTFYLLEGTTSAISNSLFTHSSPGRLTYNGAIPKDFFVTASMSFVSNSNNILASIRVAKNGETIAASEQSFFKATAADEKQVSSFIVLQLAQNDYIELYVTNDAAGSTITANHAIMVVNCI